MSIQTAKEGLIQRIQEVAGNSSSLEDLSYAAAGLAKLAEAQDTILNPDIYTIGKPGSYGFGVGAIAVEDLPAGWSALPGHEDPLSKNYGNYLDPLGSHMVFIPRFYFKWDGNTPLVIASPAAGFVLHEAFRFAPKGFMRDKCHVGNVGGKPIAKIGIAPLSTSAANNPISELTGLPANNYKGFVDAIKLRSASHHCETIFESNALAVLSLAHASASATTAVCAFKDTVPHMPKGNNNNALKDVNDNSVQYVSAGQSSYPACALAGSGFPFAKTTHNGQSCGVADVNGNMWRVNIGMTKVNNTDAVFQILKTSVNPNDLTSATLNDATNYDNIDLGTLMPTVDDADWCFGNGINQVFNTNQSITGLDNDIRVTCAGLPNYSGMSSGGTNALGNDRLYRKWIASLLPIVGGSWNNSSSAGSFSRSLASSATDSNSSVGGSACVSL